MEDTVCVQTPLMDEGLWTGAEEEDGVFAVFDGHQGEEATCFRCEFVCVGGCVV